MDKLCTVKDCNKPVKAKNMCDMHYARVKRTNSVDIIRKSVLCLVEGCGKEAFSAVYCTRHHYSFKKYNDPLHVEKAKNRICKVEGCKSSHTAKGFCKRHYANHRSKLLRGVLELDEAVKGVLADTGYWINAEGNKVAISEMSPKYKKNVIYHIQKCLGSFDDLTYWHSGMKTTLVHFTGKWEDEIAEKLNELGCAVEYKKVKRLSGEIIECYTFKSVKG
jgi:hypothetical protein